MNNHTRSDDWVFIIIFLLLIFIFLGEINLLSMNKEYSYGTISGIEYLNFKGE